MSFRPHAACVAVALSALMYASLAAADDHPVVHNVDSIHFEPPPGFPTCTAGSVQNGDPRSGPSIILAKTAARCTVPWHWHTANEHLMMVSGTATVQARGESAMTLGAGGFAMLPGHHVHQFRCTTACLMYVYSDAAFDIHYVDAQGAELSPEAALKAVKETAAKMPQ